MLEELDLIPNSPRRAMLSELESRIGEIEDAIDCCGGEYPELSVRFASQIWRNFLYFGRVERGVNLLKRVVSESDCLDEYYCEAMLGLGVLFLKIGMSEDAEEVLSKLVNISTEMGSTRHSSTGKIMISRVKADRGDFQASKELSDEVAELSAENGDFFTGALAMHAEAYRRRIAGDLDGAVDAYQRAIAVYKEKGSHEMELEERRNLGTVKFLIGKYDEAALILKRDDQEWESGIPYFDAYSKIDKAILACIEGRNEDAINLVELALSSIEDCEQRIDPDELLLIERIRVLAGGL